MRSLNIFESRAGYMFALIAWFVCQSNQAVWGQATLPPAGSGKAYGELRPPQQELVKRWISEYGKISGSQIDTASYDTLPVSNRTTFDAVTHALMKTTLTAGDGAKMGTALDVVELVEGVHGQIPNARGDHQFRLYVKLKPDGLDRLYRSREFRRTGDNTIYHIGYPINFRQQGGAPSIQFSVTRTGRRADIDVDYRSSSGPKALVNGHLTSANSDVRAGSNHVRHVFRWDGLDEWWRNLFGMRKVAPQGETTLALDLTVPDVPKVNGTAPVADAIHDYFQSWLVDAKPQEAMAYVSVRAYACLGEFQTGESIDSNLAALRILQHMRQALVAYGRQSSLGDAMEGAPLYAPGARPIVHEHGKLFSLEQIPDDIARTMDCRVRLNTTLAEELPKANRVMGETYAAMTRLLKEDGPPVVLTQVWTKEEGLWKIVSWHLENPLKAPAIPMVQERETTSPKHAASNADSSALAETTEKFMRIWLVDHQYGQAAKFFASGVSECADVRNSGSPSAFLASVGGLLPRLTDLSGLIETVEHGHDHLEAVPHPNGNAYLLAKVSDDLAPMYQCRPSAPERQSTSGPAKFGGGRFQTIFRLKNSHGTAGAILLQWILQKDRWVITSAQIITG